MAFSIRTFFKSTPILRNIYSLAANFVGTQRLVKKVRDRDLKDIFSDYHRENFWGNDESVSGPGSTLEYTERIRNELPGLFVKYKIRSILDAPCGDYNWFRYVERNDISYLGADIVPELIQKNNEIFSDENTSFRVIDITNDPLPAADLWICRDALFHLSNEHIFAALNNFLNSDIKYLLTTSNVECTENKDILTGQWRLLNLQLAPFNLPRPLQVLNDGIDGEPIRKMCLWDRETLVDVIRQIGRIRK